MSSTKSVGSRVIYLDLLKIFAVFSVVFLHVAVARFGWAPVTSFEWAVFNFYDSLVRFCVPVLIMASGATFLNPNKEIPIKTLYSKYILRMVTAFIFWSVAYALFMEIMFGGSKFSLAIVLENLIPGQIHLWFLYMIIGLYMIVPMLKKIVGDERLTRYFLILWFIFEVVINTLVTIFDASSDVKAVLGHANIKFMLGYSGYFVLGYYIKEKVLSKKIISVIYIMGILGVAFTMVATYYLSIAMYRPNAVWYEYLTPNVFFASLAVFVFFKQRFSVKTFSPKAVKRIAFFANLNFGVYLVHTLFDSIIINVFGITPLSFNPIFSIPAITIAIFALSFLASWGLSKIPFLNKYIV